jgi:hypothetical protein
MLEGCKNTLTFSFKSYILNSRAVFSRCTVPACTLSNLTADLGRCTRAMRGQSPPTMMAFRRLVLLLFVLRFGEVGVDERGTRPSSESEERKSCRREVTSRSVLGEIKFCRSRLCKSRGKIHGSYLFTEYFYSMLRFTFRAEASTLVICMEIR